MENNKNTVMEEFESNFSKKKSPVKRIITIAVFVALGIAGFLFYKESLRVHINLNEYLKVSVSGYDGYGRANVDLDMWEICEDNAEELEMNSLIRMDRFVENMSDCIDYKVSKVDNLSNGDKIVITWKVDKKKLEDKYNCRIEYTEYKKTITELDEFTDYDPFADLEVSFDGISPDGEIYLDKSNVKYSFISFKASKESDLTNGDSVKITVVQDDNFDINCINNGVRIKKTEMEYTVNGLDTYVTKVADISEENLQTMVKDAEDEIRAYAAEHWEAEESLLNVTFEGVYFLTAKEHADVSDKNYIYIIHKIDVNNENTLDGTVDTGNENGVFSYYYYTRYENVMVLSDGTFTVDLSNKVVPDGGSSWISGVYGEAFLVGDYFYKGHQDVETLFSKCVTENIDNYDYESTMP